jgi:hypothetical protein
MKEICSADVLTAEHVQESASEPRVTRTRRCQPQATMKVIDVISKHSAHDKLLPNTRSAGKKINNSTGYSVSRFGFGARFNATVKISWESLQFKMGELLIWQTN